MCFFVQTNHTRKELLFLMFKEINLRNHSSLHKIFYSLKHESIQSIASNLSLKLKENFSENELPKAIVELQLKLERYAAVGANGIVTGVFDW